MNKVAFIGICCLLLWISTICVSFGTKQPSPERPIPGPEIYQKWPIPGPEMYQKWPISGPEIYQKWPISGPEFYQKWPIAGAEMYQKWPIPGPDSANPHLRIFMVSFCKSGLDLDSLVFFSVSWQEWIFLSFISTRTSPHFLLIFTAIKIITNIDQDLQYFLLLDIIHSFSLSNL